MQITITDKAVVQAVRHFLTHRLVYTLPHTVIANLSAIRNILLYTESVYLNIDIENTRIDIDLVTRPASKRAHYKVFTVHQYKSYTTNYPQQLKPLLSFILNNIQNTIINQFSNKLSYACTTTLNNTHDRKLVNSVPQMY